MCHVLIIEDEPLIAMDLEMLLEGEGATSFAFAASEAEAITTARSRRPDIITSDVTLTEGTGPDAVESIRSTFGDIPVVYITATSGNRCAENALTRTLPKPLNRPAVAAAFQEMRLLIP